MKRTTTVVLTPVLAALIALLFPTGATAVEAPPDRVLAMYFHRTQRCPTCLKMGAYSEEAVKARFAQQIKDGTVGFYYIDFQNKKNAALAKGYGINGPALIVARITGNKVAEFKDLKDMWTKVVDKKAFLKYVQDHVAAYMKKQSIAQR